MRPPGDGVIDRKIRFATPLSHGERPNASTVAGSAAGCSGLTWCWEPPFAETIRIYHR